MPDITRPLASIDDPSYLSHVEALTELSRSGIPFLVGGTLALRRYTGTDRHTKDLDVFVVRGDVVRVLEHFARLGYRAELPFPHWLGKVFVGDLLMDVIFGSGNGVARVDAEWFAHGVPGEVCGLPVTLSPPEEMIWSKSFVQERERFDGADVLHLIRATGGTLDWERLLRRFDDDWRVLFGHLVLFGYVFPDSRHLVPFWVMERLAARLRADPSEPSNSVCNGTLLSREQYLEDVRDGLYEDARLEPRGPMSREEIEIWTAAIGAGH